MVNVEKNLNLKKRRNLRRRKVNLNVKDLKLEEEDKYSIYIRKEQVVIPWKDFNKNMAISVEYNLEY